MKTAFSNDETENLQLMLEKLSHGEKVAVKVLISEYFNSDTLDRQFVFNFSPRLSLVGESDTLDDAKEQSIKGLRFLLDTEAKEKGIQYNFENLEIEMKIYY